MLIFQYLKLNFSCPEELLSPNGFSRISGCPVALEGLVTVHLHPASVVTFRHVGDYFMMLYRENFLQERKFRIIKVIAHT